MIGSVNMALMPRADTDFARFLLGFSRAVNGSTPRTPGKRAFPDRVGAPDSHASDRR